MLRIGWDEVVQKAIVAEPLLCFPVTSPNNLSPTVMDDAVFSCILQETAGFVHVGEPTLNRWLHHHPNQNGRLGSKHHFETTSLCIEYATLMHRNYSNYRLGTQTRLPWVDLNDLTKGG